MSDKKTNVYAEARKQSGMTQAEASEKMITVSEDRLARIEGGKINIDPEDIIELADAYKRPDLMNYYCTHECAIGNGDGARKGGGKLLGACGGGIGTQQGVGVGRQAIEFLIETLVEFGLALFDGFRRIVLACHGMSGSLGVVRTSEQQRAQQP